MMLPEFLVRAGEGEIRLADHRVGLFHIVHHYNEGCSAEMLTCQYPSVPLALIHKVIAFYLENRAEVDAYVAAYRGESDRQRRTNSRRLDVTELRQRLEAMQQADKA